MIFHSGRTSAGLWPASARARFTFHFGRCAGAALFFAILLSMLRLALVRAKARPSACPRICLRKRGARVLPSSLHFAGAALFFAFLLSMLRLALVRVKARPSACPRICLRKRGARVLPSSLHSYSVCSGSRSCGLKPAPRLENRAEAGRRPAEGRPA